MKNSATTTLMPFFLAAITALTLSSCASQTSFSPNDDLVIPLPADALENTNSAVGVEYIAQADRVDRVSITGVTLDGNELTAPNNSGRITVINSWASWCAPCREELPEFAAVAIDPEFADVDIVGLNVNDNESSAQSMSQDFTFPSIFDPRGTLLPTIPGVPPAALPSTVVLDSQGQIAARIIGPVPPGELANIIRWVQSN
jgi:thiol-disulfide isomerase/thioredoxin